MNCPLLSALLGLTIALAAGTAGAAVPDHPVASSTPPSLRAPATASDPYTTAYQYTLTFYPRWFTKYQSDIGLRNRLVAPKTITSLYHSVVAINVDTLYASTFLDLTSEPVMVTVPATTDVYSALLLDEFGTVLPGIPAGQAGVYAMVGPGWQGTLPDGVARIDVPYSRALLIFRADKYASTGQDTQAAAQAFRAALQVTPLSTWLTNPAAGATTVLTELAFAIPFKGIADGAVANRTLDFLKAMQKAVRASDTQPLTVDQQALSDSFNVLFADAANSATMAAAAQAAHADLVADYLGHTLPGSAWISFTNIGAWDDSPQGVLDRAAITEFLQYGNNHDAAVYFHVFNDGAGAPLDGRSGPYQLTFSKAQLPEVKRFWSLTAYTPQSVELAANLAQKHNVASYTPGLVSAADGSVTITFSTARPANVPEANWLPVPKGPFNVMLRAYGPQGSVLDNSYVPPAIVRTAD